MHADALVVAGLVVMMCQYGTCPCKAAVYHLTPAQKQAFCWWPKTWNKFQFLSRGITVVQTIEQTPDTQQQTQQEGRVEAVGDGDGDGADFNVLNSHKLI